ncbi:MAG: hypothetical protein AB8F74_16345, partial [Saprospiraceae bacterium]
MLFFCKSDSYAFTNAALSVSNSPCFYYSFSIDDNIAKVDIHSAIGKDSRDEFAISSSTSIASQTKAAIPKRDTN